MLRTQLLVVSVSTLFFALAAGPTSGDDPAATGASTENTESGGAPGNDDDGNGGEGNGDDGNGDRGAIPAGTIQPADDVVEPLKPVVPRDAATQQRLEAVAHFMAGQLAEKRKDVLAAVEEYKLAVELDPDGFAVYPSYVPMAFLLGRGDEAIAAARQAATRFDSGHDLVRGLAGMMAATNQVDEAATLLSETLNIPRVRDNRMSKLLVHRDLGVVFRSAGRNEEAAQQLRIVFEAAEADDNRLTASELKSLFGEGGGSFEEMGATFLDAELPDLAVRAFARASEADPSSPAVYSFNLASVFKKTGRPEEAFEQLEVYLNAQLQTKGRAAYELLEELLADLEREAELLPRLKSLVEVDRRNTALRYFYADTLRDAGNVSEAEEQYRIALGGGRDLRGLVGLMSLIRLKEEIDEADGEDLAELLLKAYPVVAQSGQGGEEFEAEWAAIREREPLLDAVAKAGLAKVDTEVQTLEFFPAYLFGRLMIDAKRATAAAEFYRYAFKLRNDAPIQLYGEITEALEDAEEFAIAADFYRDALARVDEGDVEIRGSLLYQLSTALVRSQQVEAAFEAIREAQELEPTKLGWQFWEGVIASEADRLDLAAEIFQRFIDSNAKPRDEDPLVERARFQLSVIYVQQGDIEKGGDVLLKILESDPENVQANNDLGYLWADEGINLERAEQMIRKAVAAEPDNAAYLDSLGWVLFKTDRAEAAIEPLEKASKDEKGQDTVIFEHLADAYVAVDRAADAITAYERALELETEKAKPDAEVVDRIRDKLASLKKSTDASDAD